MPGSHQGGRNPTQLPAPVLPQSQSLSKAKAIKTPIILRICYHLARHLILLSRMCLALSDPRARERPLVISQSLALLAGCSNASLSMACVMRRRFGVIVGLTLPADLAYLRRRRARLVVWTLFHYCEFTLLLYGVCRFDDRNDGRDEIDKVDQSYYHGDPSTALLEVLDPVRNVAFNVRFFTPPHLEAFFSDMKGLLGSLLERSDRPVADSVHLHGQYARHNPSRLLDRCEIIQLSGYTHGEKLHIARRCLPP